MHPNRSTSDCIILSLIFQHFFRRPKILFVSRAATFIGLCPAVEVVEIVLDVFSILAVADRFENMGDTVFAIGHATLPRAATRQGAPRLITSARSASSAINSA